MKHYGNPSIGVPKPVDLAALGIYFKDGLLWRDREDFEYREYEYWVVEDTGFTWDPESETRDNDMSVSWFQRDGRFDTYDEAFECAMRLKRLHPYVMIRVRLVQKTVTSLIVHTPK